MSHVEEIKSLLDNQSANLEAIKASNEARFDAIEKHLGRPGNPDAGRNAAPNSPEAKAL